MEAVVWFQFGPLHVPLGRRTWQLQVEYPVQNAGRSYLLGMIRPKRFRTHFLDDDSTKVADALLIMYVVCELEDKEQSFREVFDIVLSYWSPRIEAIRIKTKQPHLRLSGRDLEFVRITTPDHSELPDMTRKFSTWLESQEGSRPLPTFSQSDWETLLDKQIGNIPLYESLLLDAELLMESDPKLCVMYSAIACETFIQTWLDERSHRDEKLRAWLDWAKKQQGPEGNVSIRAYYDIGLFLATGKSLAGEPTLSPQLKNLFNARNAVAHRGKLERYTSAQAISTARSVIDWVQGLG